jgi:hypothetical protein
MIGRGLLTAGVTWPGIILWDDLRTLDYLETGRRSPVAASSCRRSRNRRKKMAEFINLTGVQEIFAVTDTYEQSDRLRSYRLLAEVVSKTPVAE